MTLVYSRLNERTTSSDPINENRFGAKKRPIKVIIIDTTIPYIIVCAKKPSILSLLFSPILFAIKDVPPTVTPTQAAIIIKYIGNDFAKADKASGYIFPAK
tara:strand:+ start:101 stop:403 length:303 start_codon:yes stop_codon:yes gene_type:complete